MSLDAERAVLGALLKDHTLMDECFLTSDDFSDQDQEARIFRVMQYACDHFTDAPNPLDPVLIAEKWGAKLQQIGGISYLMQLRDSVPSTDSFTFYQRSIRADRVQREIAELGRDIAANGGGDISQLKAKMEQLDDMQQGDGNGGPVHMATVLDGHAATIIKRSSSRGITGAKTANDQINEMSGGHQNGDLEIVAARPSIGKTQYVLNDMDAATQAGWAAVLFSLEMEDLKIVERLVSTIGGIQNKKIKSGLLSENDWDSYSKAVDIIASRNLFIDDTSGATVEYIRRQVKLLRKKFPKLVVYVDYLQFVETEKKFNSTKERVGYVTKSLKRIARELDVSMVVISAVGRDCEKRPDKRPLMSDLRESGDIESDADVVLFLYRDDYYNADTPKKGIVELIIAKGRDIGTGTFEMIFRRDTGRFINMTQDQRYELDKKVKEYEQQRKNRR